MVLRSLLLYPYDGDASAITPAMFQRLKRRSANAAAVTWILFLILAASTRWWASAVVQGSAWVLVVVLAIYLPVNHASIIANLKHRMDQEGVSA